MVNSKKNLIKIGSTTAKNGFKNEDDVIDKFNNWKKDEDAKKWLLIMGYKLKDIEKVEAIKLHGYKTDVQVQITIYLKKAISSENLSVKLVSNPRGFNQIDKRWVKKYVEMWNIPDDISETLKMFTGEIKPKNIKNLRDKRRMFLDEMEKDRRENLLRFIEKNKMLIVSDIIKGRDQFSAEWMLVALKQQLRNNNWVLKSINEAMNTFGNGEIYVTDKGSIRIGKITMQRKGGDGGRDSANMLQFKINPVELFNK